MNLPTTDAALAPCRLCGAAGKVLRFAANRAIPEPFDIWTCSSGRALGGTCPADGYFAAEFWNEANRP